MYSLYQKSKNVVFPKLATSSPLTPTGKDILGPFYRPGSPFTTKLVVSPTLILTGKVLDTQAIPMNGAYVDFWQANPSGQYDIYGPNLRGIQLVGADGAYRLETVHPGFYDISDPADPQPHEFRCSHIHAKIWYQGVDILTTQLYFANDPYDATDHWFNKDRELKFTDSVNATFDFVVERS